MLFAKLNLQHYSQLATLHEALADRFNELYQAVMQQLVALPPAPHPYQQPFALMHRAPGFVAAVPDVDVNELVRLLEWEQCAHPLSRYWVCGTKVSLLCKLLPCTRCAWPHLK